MHSLKACYKTCTLVPHCDQKKHEVRRCHVVQNCRRCGLQAQISQHVLRRSGCTSCASNLGTVHGKSGFHRADQLAREDLVLASMLYADTLQIQLKHCLH